MNPEKRNRAPRQARSADTGRLDSEPETKGNARRAPAAALGAFLPDDVRDAARARVEARAEMPEVGTQVPTGAAETFSDVALEGQVIGSILAGWSMMSRHELDASVFFAPAHTRIAAAMLTCAGWHYTVDVEGDELVRTLPGLDEHLIEPDRKIARDLAGRSPVCTHVDHDRLVELAAARERLVAIDDERADLLETFRRGTWPR